MNTIKRIMLSASALIASAGVAIATTWQETVNETLDMVVGLLPKFGDLLTGVGTNIIWPVVYILIILGVAAIVLGLFGMITGIAFAVIAVVQKFSHGMGGRHGK